MMVRGDKIEVVFNAAIQQVFGESSSQISAAQAPTLRDLLNIICTSPQRREKIFDQHGQLRSDVIIFRNGRNVLFLDGLGTKLEGGDAVSIFPPTYGG